MSKLPQRLDVQAPSNVWMSKLPPGTHKEFRPLFWLHVISPLLKKRGVSSHDLDRVITPGVRSSHCEWLRASLDGTIRFDSSEPLARDIIVKKVAVVEKHLAGREFLVGASMTMADVAWFTRIDLLPRLGVAIDAERFPRIRDWRRRLARRPAFEAEPPPAI